MAAAVAQYSEKLQADAKKAFHHSHLLSDGPTVCAQLHYHLASTGLIKDRRHRLRIVAKCFVCSEVVEWLVTKAEICKSEALDILNYLVFKELVVRVSDTSHVLEGGNAFYRFRVDDPDAPAPSKRNPRRMSSHDCSIDTCIDARTGQFHLPIRDDISTNPPRQSKWKRVSGMLPAGDVSTVPRLRGIGRTASSVTDPPCTLKYLVGVAESMPTAPYTDLLIDEPLSSPDRQRAMKACSIPDDSIFHLDDLGVASDDAPSWPESRSSTISSESNFSKLMVTQTNSTAGRSLDSISQQDMREYVHELRRLWKRAGLIKEHRYRFLSHAKSFIASDVLCWIVESSEGSMEHNDALDLLQAMEAMEFIHHVTDAHHFHDSHHLFRFRADDGTEVPEAGAEVLELGASLYQLAKETGPPLICDRSYRGKLYPSCFVGREFVDKLLEWKAFETRAAAVTFGRQLVVSGLMHHVCFEHQFKDAYLFFRFLFDESEKDATGNGPASRLLRLGRTSKKFIFKLRDRANSFAAVRSGSFSGYKSEPQQHVPVFRNHSARGSHAASFNHRNSDSGSSSSSGCGRESRQSTDEAMFQDMGRPLSRQPAPNDHTPKSILRGCSLSDTGIACFVDSDSDEPGELRRTSSLGCQDNEGVYV